MRIEPQQPVPSPAELPPRRRRPEVFKFNRRLNVWERTKELYPDAAVRRSVKPGEVRKSADKRFIIIG